MTGLAAEFPSVSEADWRALAGRLPAQPDSPVGPIYPAADGAPIPGRMLGTAWTIIARVAAGTDAGGINSRIRQEVEGGATGVELVFASSPSAHGGGLDAASVDWAGVLRGVRLAGTTFRIDAGEASPGLAAALIAFAEAEGAALDLTVTADPIATLAAQGRLAHPVETSFDALAVLDADRTRSVVADGAVWHNAGASPAEELAAVVAALAEYLRLFDGRGVPPTRALQRMAVTLAADADQFTTIAKMRAVRLLQSRLAEAIGAGPERLPLHAATSWRMLSRLDPHTNILRTTSAVFAAGIGGADSVTALPFDAASSGDDHFARRIARNSQTILIDESELAVVADPAAGAGAVEALTDHLAGNAWTLFRGIEREGGLLAAVRSGTMQRRIAETRDKRIEGVRQGRIEIVGTNVFPDGAEQGLPPPSMRPTMTPESGAAETVEALRFVRPAETFEMLRTRSGAAGGPPLDAAGGASQ